LSGQKALETELASLDAQTSMPIEYCWRVAKNLHTLTRGE
jgi:hypothetical protein